MSGQSSFFTALKAVAWSFVGIRKQSGYEADLAKVNPLHVVLVGLLAVALIVVGLVVLVNWVVAK
jgi:hypothetical protein